MQRRRVSRGFTLVELLVTVSVALILLGVAGWSGQRALIAFRVSGAANEFVFFVRQAAAIAARTNSRMAIVVDNNGPAACNPSYRLQTIPVAGGTAVEYHRVCLNADFPGVALASGGTTAAIRCPAETAAGLPAMTNCLMCTGTTSVFVFPSGEVATAEAAGETLVFAPKHEPTSTQVLAVGIRNTSGKTQVYRPQGAGWECP